MAIQLLESCPFFSQIVPEVEGFPILNSSFNILIIVGLYLLVVLSWGPDYMKNRPPYNLRTFILVYNASQSFINVYLLYKGIPHLLSKNYFELTPDPIATRLSYYYFLLKIYDLVETVMFVMRKKNNQISFLHLYHHIMVIASSFYGCRFEPGGHHLVYGLINTIVHAVMYTYYFLSAYDSKIAGLQKYKKCITQIQMVQFVIVALHYSWPLYFGHCCISKVLSCFCLFQALVMIVLFGQFYMKTYIKKTK